MTILSSKLRNVPLISSVFRRMRRIICPTQHDIYERNSQRFANYLDYATKKVTYPIFVKVGANDGLTGDPCERRFIDSQCWRGILIEPVPHLAVKLAANYSDPQRFTIETIAIGSSPGSKTFYYMCESAKQAFPHLPEHFNMLGSFSRQHILNHLDSALEPFIQEIQIEVQTLSDVLKRNKVTSIDVLQIDTEGYDWEVLKSLDLNKVLPNVVYIEHKHLSVVDRNAMFARLSSHGYHVLDCGNDFFARLRKNL